MAQLLRIISAAVGTVGAADPEPISKTVLIGIALTALIGSVVQESVSKMFRDFDKENGD